MRRLALLAALLLAPALASAQGAIGVASGGGVSDPLIVADVQGTTSVCVLGPLDTANSVCLLSNEIRFEGAADAFEGSLVAPSISADWTWTLPSGTTTLAGYSIAGTFSASQAFTAPLDLPDGSAAAPALDWDVDGSGTGFYHPAVNQIGVVSNGSEYFRWVGAYFAVGAAADAFIRMGSDEHISWANNDSALGGTLDVGLERNAAGVLEVTNGSTGRGSLIVGGAAQLQLVDDGAKPTCDATSRGSIWYEAGGAGVADSIEVCAKDSGDSYAWTVLATIS